MASGLENKQNTGIIYRDFAKAFDRRGTGGMAYTLRKIQITGKV